MATSSRDHHFSVRMEPAMLIVILTSHKMKDDCQHESELNSEMACEGGTVRWIGAKTWALHGSLAFGMGQRAKASFISINNTSIHRRPT